MSLRKCMLWTMGALMDVRAWGYLKSVGKQAVTVRQIHEFDQLATTGYRPDNGEIRACIMALEVPEPARAAQVLNEYKYRDLPEQDANWVAEEAG